MILPKIIYAVVPVTLSFSYPPVMKPASDPQEWVRNDTDAYAGQRQSVFFRADIFKILQMDNVPNADMPNWELFMAFARTGDKFTYYPDATVAGTHTDYTLDDKKWTPVKIAARAVEYNKFSLRLRQYVA